MTRNLKVLGLALVAAFALSAVVASAAMAEKPAHFGPGDEAGGHSILEGEQLGENNDVFNVDGGETRCPKVTYAGTATSTKATEQTVTPNYPTETCKLVLGGFTVGTVHINMNGCDYLFTAGTYTAASNDAHGSVHIQCPVGQSITVVATTGGVTKCTIHIPPQTISGVTYTNGGTAEKMDLVVDVNASGITYTQTAGEGFGKCTGFGEEHTKNGTYVGKATLRAFNTVGAQVPITVTG